MALFAALSMDQRFSLFGAISKRRRPPNRDKGYSTSEEMMKLQMLQPRLSSVKLESAAVPPKTSDPFYSSKAWIELRDWVRWEAAGYCQTPGCGRAERRMFVDHIVELRDGGQALDRANVWLLCGACHSLKTASERTRRAAAPPREAVRVPGGNGSQTAPSLTHRIFPVRHSPKTALTARGDGEGRE